jgi:hypothetical protein
MVQSVLHQEHQYLPLRLPEQHLVQALQTQLVEVHLVQHIPHLSYQLQLPMIFQPQFWVTILIQRQM